MVWLFQTDFHVVFLDESVTRAWVKRNRIKKFQLDHLVSSSVCFLVFILPYCNFMQSVSISLTFLWQADVSLYNFPLSIQNHFM